LAEHFEGLKIEDFDAAAVDVDKTIRAQLGQRSIQMGNAETKCVTHYLLRKWQMETQLGCAACRRQSRIYFQKQMREPFGWVTAADVDDLIGTNYCLVDR
jgi:hypothetical protein